MSVRLFANVVYAWLTEGLDGPGHKRLDDYLDAPLEGWDAVNRRFLRRLGVVG